MFLKFAREELNVQHRIKTGSQTAEGIRITGRAVKSFCQTLPSEVRSGARVCIFIKFVGCRSGDYTENP